MGDAAAAAAAAAGARAHRLKVVLVAGTHSGVGKTALSVGLMAAYRCVAGGCGGRGVRSSPAPRCR